MSLSLLLLCNTSSLGTSSSMTRFILTSLSQQTNLAKQASLTLTHNEVPEGGLLDVPDDGGHGMPTVKDQHESK